MTDLDTESALGVPLAATTGAPVSRLDAFLGGDRWALPAPPPYRRRQWPFLALVVVALAIVPTLYGGTRYHDGLLNNAMLLTILSLGFYWCFSLAGEFSFAVFAMYATGSYVSLWGAQHFHGFWVGFLLATIITGLLGGLIRLMFFKLSPLYFAIATFGVGGLLLILYREWTSFTGG